MGWSFSCSRMPRSYEIEQLTKNEDFVYNGERIVRKCLAQCFRGGAFSGVLWTVWDVTKHSPAEATEPTKSYRYIGCDIMECRGRCWGYKDLSESMGPHYYSCPVSYLDMVPVANEEWRVKVREYNSQVNAKRANTRKMNLAVRS